MVALQFYIGQKFGDYEVIRLPIIENGYRRILCKCKCGVIINAYASNVKRLTKCKKCCGKDLHIIKRGLVHESLIVLERLPNRIVKIKCLCGTIKDIDAGSFKYIKTCGCIFNKIGKEHYAYKGFGDISGTIFAQIKRNAIKKNRDFDLDIEYLANIFNEQNQKCAISNMDICIGNKQKETTASLDRIDNTKGYIKDNVWWVHKDINRLKSNFELNYFKQLCKLVADQK